MLQMETVTNAGMGGSSLLQWANGKLYGKYYQGYDLVTIMHGINDHDNSPNSPLGTLQPHGSAFDKSTYIGAYQFIIETIKTNSPNTEIALLKSQYVSNDNWANGEGLTMTDYRNAVDVVAESYGLPVFDASTVITASNYTKYLSDGIHPTADGQALLGDAIGKWLATI
jgi:lysophospholipase L1-like esterase